jgi:hypothetical protein
MRRGHDELGQSTRFAVVLWSAALLCAVVALTLTGCAQKSPAAVAQPTTTRPFSFPSLPPLPATAAPATSPVVADPVTTIAPIVSSPPTTTIVIDNQRAYEPWQFVTTLVPRSAEVGGAELSPTTSIVSALSNTDLATLQRLAVGQLDISYVELGKKRPDVQRLLTFIASADRAAFDEYFQQLVTTDNRWKFPYERVETLMIESIESTSATTAIVATCEYSNVIRFVMNDEFKEFDDEVVSDDFETTFKRQAWIKEDGQWKATIEIQRTVLKGENRCPK